MMKRKDNTPSLRASVHFFKGNDPGLFFCLDLIQQKRSSLGIIWSIKTVCEDSGCSILNRLQLIDVSGRATETLLL